MNPINITTIGEKIQYRIFDNAGKQLYSANANLQQGTNILELEMSKLAAGVYSLQVSGPNTTQVTRFIKK